MTLIPTAQLLEMLKCAEKAPSTGPWYHTETPRIPHSFVASEPDYPRSGVRICECIEPDDAEYVASCDPQTIIALLREVLRGRGEDV